MSSGSSSQPIGNTASKSCNMWGKFIACYHIFDTALAFTSGANRTKGVTALDVVEFKKNEKNSCFKIRMGGWGTWILSAALIGSAAYD
jgi:hypothetical protein